MIASRRNIAGYSKERCHICHSSVERGGVWYRDNRRVCHGCWQWGEMIEAQDKLDRSGKRESSAAVVGALGLCVLSAVLWLCVAGMVLWLV